MAETQNKSSNGNGNGNAVWKQIVGWVLTVAVSVVLSVYSSGEASGKQQEKITQLEARVEKAERLYSTDHDLLIEIKTKLINIENMLKMTQEAKSK